MRHLIIALAAGATALSGAAFAAKAPLPMSPAPASGTGLPSGQCFRSSDIRSHKFADGKTLLVNVRNKDVYRITMRGACMNGAMDSDPLITRIPPGSNIICKPIDMDVSVAKGGFGFSTPCFVDSIVKVSPEELAALPRKLKP